jgi:hypothetical protein
MVLVEQAFELGAAPSRRDQQPGVQRGEDPPDRAKGELVEPPSLGARHL